MVFGPPTPPDDASFLGTSHGPDDASFLGTSHGPLYARTDIVEHFYLSDDEALQDQALQSLPKNFEKAPQNRCLVQCPDCENYTPVVNSYGPLSTLYRTEANGLLIVLCNHCQPLADSTPGSAPGAAPAPGPGGATPTPTAPIPGPGGATPAAATGALKKKLFPRGQTAAAIRWEKQWVQPSYFFRRKGLRDGLHPVPRSSTSWERVVLEILVQGIARRPNMHQCGFVPISLRERARLYWKDGHPIGWYSYQYPGDFDEVKSPTGKFYGDEKILYDEPSLPNESSLPTLNTLFVLPEHRRQGVAGEMVVDFFRKKTDKSIAGDTYSLAAGDKMVIDKPHAGMKKIINTVLSREELEHLVLKESWHEEGVAFCDDGSFRAELSWVPARNCSQEEWLSARAREKWMRYYFTGDKIL